MKSKKTIPKRISIELKAWLYFSTVLSKNEMDYYRIIALAFTS